MFTAFFNNYITNLTAQQKKPKDKPKRPLSAYNFFFKAEREKILKVVLAEKPDEVKNDPESDDYLDEEAIKRLKKEGGKVSFEEMGKLIGQRWKNIDPDRLATYSELASEDTERYKTEMQEYNGRQEAKMRSEALKPPVQFQPQSSGSGQPGGHHGAVLPGESSGYGQGPPPPQGMDPSGRMYMSGGGDYAAQMSNMSAFAGGDPNAQYYGGGMDQFGGYGAMGMGGYAMGPYGGGYGGGAPQDGGAMEGGAYGAYGGGGGMGMMGGGGFQGGGMMGYAQGPPPPEYCQGGPPPEQYPPHMYGGGGGYGGGGQGWGGQ